MTAPQLPSPASSSRRTRSSRLQRDKTSDRESEREKEQQQAKKVAKETRKKERAERAAAEELLREKKREREAELARTKEREREATDRNKKDRQRENDLERGRLRERLRGRSEHTSRADLSPVSVSSNSTITPASFSTPSTNTSFTTISALFSSTSNNMAAATTTAAAAQTNTSFKHSQTVEQSPSPSLVPVSTIIHPRVAVVLGIPRRWHFVLFVCRLLSFAPACYWGLPRAAGMLLRLGALWVSEIQGIGMATSGGEVDRLVLRLVLDRRERRALFTEVTLALIWVSRDLRIH